MMRKYTLIAVGGKPTGNMMNRALESRRKSVCLRLLAHRPYFAEVKFCDAIGRFDSSSSPARRQLLRQ